MSRTPVAIFLVIPGLSRLFFALKPDYTDSDDAPAAESTPVSRSSACVYDVAIQVDAMSPRKSM